MGSGSVPHCTPLFISAVQKASNYIVNQARKQTLHPPQVEPRVKRIKGEVTKAILCDVNCESSIGKFFDVNHAFVVFVFSSGEWVRAEIAGFADGASIYVFYVQRVDLRNYRTFECTQRGIKIDWIIHWCNQYYQDGNFDIEKRNCYDFVRFMLQDQFSGGDQFAQWWKQQQLKKVPSILK